MKVPEFAVILPAGGTGSRFGGDKLSEPLEGATVLERTIAAFESREDVRQVVIAGRAGPPSAKRTYAAGGACRAESVRNGLQEVHPAIEWVAIHDAARPLVSAELIDRVFTAALQHGAAAPALPVQLTIKLARGPLPARVEHTVPREQLWAMQTPQFMRRAELLRAFAHCPIPLANVTDDLQLIELAGETVWLVQGDERNIKITRAVDLRLAKFFLE